MSWVIVATNILIFFGSAVMLASILGTGQVLILLGRNPYVRFWRILLGFMLFLLFGYLAAILMVLAGLQDFVMLLTGVVFFFAALFVYLVVRVGYLTIGDLLSHAAKIKEMLGDLEDSQRELQKAHDELELRVQERTAQLAGANEALHAEIVERRRAEESLRDSEERYALGLRGANDGLWDWNLATRQIHYSARWKSMLGFTDEEIGNRIEEWIDLVHPQDGERVRADIAAHLDGFTPLLESEYRIQHKDGTFRWVLCRGLAVRDASGKAYRMAGSQTDITARKLAEEQLLHDALHDTLTGLPNRALFVDRLGRSVASARRHPERLFAVLFMDLDRFKLVNDSLGHACGDQLLVALARRLEGCIRAGDTVARLGGDEFAILLEEIREVAESTTVADRVLNVLSLPFELSARQISVTASIGIAIGSACYHEAEDLLRDSDTAMYRAKALGRMRSVLFDPSMHTRVVALLECEADLRRAIERGEFLVYYQPVLSTKSGRITGIEALLRWQHPERGLVQPADFIPIAEEAGLIVPIGEWVLRTACRQAQAWRQAGHPELRIAVNFSARQFREEGLADLIRQVLAETGLPPQALEVEITESAAMQELNQTVKTLDQLTEMGVHISIDDFGNHYSALNYLKRFPIGSVRVDRSFVRDLPRSEDNVAITSAIVSMARSLKLTVVGEGVETQEQLAFLESVGCDQVQGFLFCRPLPAGDLAAFLDGAPKGEQFSLQTAVTSQ